MGSEFSKNKPVKRNSNELRKKQIRPKRNLTNIYCDVEKTFNSLSEKRNSEEDISKKKSNEGEIKQIFFKYQNRFTSICCDEEESFSSSVEEFQKRNELFNSNLNFFCNSKPIRKDMKFKEIEPYMSTIYINAFETNSLTGGNQPMNFTDLSKQIHEEIYFSKDAPSYRIVTKGINIFGKCNSKICPAGKKIVVVPLENIRTFDLIEEREKLVCPECEGFIYAQTVGFHLCEYKISGRKLEGESFEFSGRADSKKSIQYYDPDKNGNTILVDMIFEVTQFLS